MCTDAVCVVAAAAAAWFASDTRAPAKCQTRPEVYKALHEQLYGSDEVEDDVLYVLVCRVIMGYSIRTMGRINGICMPLDKSASETKSVFHETQRDVFRERVLTGVVDPETKKALDPPLHHHSLIAEIGGAIVRFR